MKKRKILKCRSADRDNKITSDLCKNLQRCFNEIVLDHVHLHSSKRHFNVWIFLQTQRLSRSTALKHRLHHRRRPASGLNDTWHEDRARGTQWKSIPMITSVRISCTHYTFIYIPAVCGWRAHCCQCLMLRRVSEKRGEGLESYSCLSKHTHG